MKLYKRVIDELNLCLSKQNISIDNISDVYMIHDLSIIIILQLWFIEK